MQNFSYTTLALFATLFTWSLTALGAVSVVFFKNVNKNWMDGMLGFAGGVMIAASFWSLLSPAIDMAESLEMTPWLVALAGFLGGGLLLFGGDKLYSRLERSPKLSGKLNRSSKWKRCLMLVFSITLHNIPEGLAVGVAFGSLTYDLEGATILTAFMLALGIGIQNLPEGAAISLPLRQEGSSRGRAFLLGTLSGSVEPIFGILVVLVAAGVRPLMPWLLSFAAGAMIYVVIEELVPQAHSKAGTCGFVGGFLIMMILDVALG